MGKNRKSFKEGDLVIIRTPPFHKRVLSDDLEGKSGVLLKISETVIPSSIQKSDVVFDVLIDGRIMQFYNDRYFATTK